MQYPLLPLSLPCLPFTLRRPRPFGTMRLPTVRLTRLAFAPGIPLALVVGDHQLLPGPAPMTEQLSIVHQSFHAFTRPLPIQLPPPDLRSKLSIRLLPLMPANPRVWRGTIGSLGGRLVVAPKGQLKWKETTEASSRLGMNHHCSSNSAMAALSLLRSFSRVGSQ